MSTFESILMLENISLLLMVIGKPIYGADRLRCFIMYFMLDSHSFTIQYQYYFIVANRNSTSEQRRDLITMKL